MDDTLNLDEVICQKRGACGVITLNRPPALNALTLQMVRSIKGALSLWLTDASITRIVIISGGGRAFSAGGDIRRLYEQGKAGQHAEQMQFWTEEYELNLTIKNYPKPYIALIDGIVMGGGVGVSLHGSHVVAGDRFAFAMPEVGIGFFPDVGATWFLPRLKGSAGMRLALTGGRVLAEEAVNLGLAHWRVASGSFGAVLEALVAGNDVNQVLSQRALVPNATLPHPCEAAFAAASLAGIYEALANMAAQASETAAQILMVLNQKSPTSLVVAEHQMRLGKNMTMMEAMRVEWNIVSHLCREPDFYEGVRALTIDKDQNPKWSPANLEAVDRQTVYSWFETAYMV